MKIVIPVDEKCVETSVCISFGRTPYFLIYDVETKESTFIDNTAISTQGGAGIKAAQAIVDHDVKALITPRCGQNAAEVLEAAAIKIYKSMGNSVVENIQYFEEEKLQLLQEIHAGFHHHGGN